MSGDADMCVCGHPRQMHHEVNGCHAGDPPGRPCECYWFQGVNDD